MSGRPTDSANERRLWTLFRAIARGDRPKVGEILERSPALALEAAGVGATRAEARSHFFESIHHYAYAGDTPLHIAAAAHAPGIAGDLLARGAAVRVRNRRGAEPLHYAADGVPDSPRWDPGAQADTVRFLVAAGALPDAHDDSGVAPIHRAVRSRCAAAVRALLEAGADSRGRNASGSTPLHLAVQTTGRGGSGSPVSRAQQAEIIALLLAHGASPSDRNASGRAVRDVVRAAWIHAVLGGS